MMRMIQLDRASVYMKSAARGGPQFGSRTATLGCAARRMLRAGTAQASVRVLLKAAFKTIFGVARNSGIRIRGACVLALQPFSCFPASSGHSSENFRCTIPLNWGNLMDS